MTVGPSATCFYGRRFHSLFKKNVICADKHLTCVPVVLFQKLTHHQVKINGIVTELESTTLTFCLQLLMHSSLSILPRTFRTHSIHLKNTTGLSQRLACPPPDIYPLCSGVFSLNTRPHIQPKPTVFAQSRTNSEIRACSWSIHFDLADTKYLLSSIDSARAAKPIFTLGICLTLLVWGRA
jgi:hypothetical protein